MVLALYNIIYGLKHRRAYIGVGGLYWEWSKRFEHDGCIHGEEAYVCGKLLFQNGLSVSEPNGHKNKGDLNSEGVYI